MRSPKRCEETYVFYKTITCKVCRWYVTCGVKYLFQNQIKKILRDVHFFLFIILQRDRKLIKE